MTNEILLSLDLINVKDSHNFSVGVSKPWLFVATPLKLQTVLFLFFFQILRLQMGGAAYLRMWLIHEHLW